MTRVSIIVFPQRAVIPHNSFTEAALLISRPRSEKTLSWRRCTVVTAEIRTAIIITSPRHFATARTP